MKVIFTQLLITLMNEEDKMPNSTNTVLYVDAENGPMRLSEQHFAGYQHLFLWKAMAANTVGDQK